MKLIISLLFALSAYGQLVDSKPRQLNTGTVLPATCIVGQSFFKSDATAGQNLYGCTAANTWTVMGVGYYIGASCQDNNFTASTTAFCANFATFATSGNEATRQLVIPRSGILQSAYITTGATTPTADVVCKVRVNEADQATVTVAASGYAGPKTSSTTSIGVSVTAGQRLSVSCLPGATTQTSWRAWSVFIQ